MASFIPNFNAPSQNYGNILNMSYRRGMDPRKRRRRVLSAAPEGTRVETNPDGTQVSVAPRTTRPDRITDGSEFQDAWSRERDQHGNLRGTIEFNNAAAAPAGTKIITNPDGTQVSVTPKSVRESSNTARRQLRAKRVAEVAAGQKRTKPSDLLLSPEEMRMRDRAGAMKAIRSMMDSGVAPPSWKGPVTLQTSATEPPKDQKTQKTREPLKRALVKFDPSWEFAQGRGPVARPNPNPNAPGSPLVATPSQQFANTRRQRQNEAMARKVSRDLENFKDSRLAQLYGTQVLDPKLKPQFISDIPFPRRGKGIGMGGVPTVNEAVARMAMSPEDRRYLDEQDRQRKMAGLLYSAPTGLVNWYSSLFD